MIAEFLIILCFTVWLLVGSIWFWERNEGVNELRMWMVDEWYSRIGLAGDYKDFHRAYQRAPSYNYMLFCFWIPLSRFRDNYLAELCEEDLK